MTTSSPTGTHIPAVYRPPAAVITSARGSSSAELSQRMRRYTIAMAFRMACFLGMIVVHGWVRWVLLAVAVFMPYLAVVLANQSDQRSATPLGAVSPDSITAITSGTATESAVGVVIDGEVVEGASIDGEVVTGDQSAMDDADDIPLRRAA